MKKPNKFYARVKRGALIRKLNLLDAIDEQSGSGKLDLIVQLPYTVKSDLKRAQAKERKKELSILLLMIFLLSHKQKLRDPVSLA